MNVSFENRYQPLSCGSALTWLSLGIGFLFVAGPFFIALFGIWGASAVQVLIFGLPAFWFFKIRQAPLSKWPLLGLPDASSLVLCWVATALVCFGVDQLMSWHVALKPMPEHLKHFYTNLPVKHLSREAVLKTIHYALIPAFFEELFFRGFLQQSLKTKFRKPVAIFLTALLFGLAHGEPWAMPEYLILGLFLGFLMEWKNTLWLPMVAHLTNNLWALWVS